MIRPLPINHKAIKRHRYEAWVGRKIADGRYAEIETGRFATLVAAKAWVAEAHPEAEVARFTYFSERTGWQAQRVTA